MDEPLRMFLELEPALGLVLHAVVRVDLRALGAATPVPDVPGERWDVASNPAAWATPLRRGVVALLDFLQLLLAERDGVAGLAAQDPVLAPARPWATPLPDLNPTHVRLAMIDRINTLAGHSIWGGSIRSASDRSSRSKRFGSSIPGQSGRCLARLGSPFGGRATRLRRSERRPPRVSCQLFGSAKLHPPT